MKHRVEQVVCAYEIIPYRIDRRTIPVLTFNAQRKQCNNRDELMTFVSLSMISSYIVGSPNEMLVCGRKQHVLGVEASWPPSIASLFNLNRKDQPA